MILKLLIMAERSETGFRITGPRAALMALLAGAGFSIAGCDQSSAQADSSSGEIRLATATEAADFASLPERVRAEIRQNYADCIADVEEFARDVAGDDEAEYLIEYQDGEADCDSIRNSNIRSAKSHQDMDELTRKITSG